MTDFSISSVNQFKLNCGFPLAKGCFSRMDESGAIEAAGCSESSSCGRSGSAGDAVLCSPGASRGLQPSPDHRSDFEDFSATSATCASDPHPRLASSGLFAAPAQLVCGGATCSSPDADCSATLSSASIEDERSVFAALTAAVRAGDADKTTALLADARVTEAVWIASCRYAVARVRASRYRRRECLDVVCALSFDPRADCSQAYDADLLGGLCGYDFASRADSRALAAVARDLRSWCVPYPDPRARHSMGSLCIDSLRHRGIEISATTRAVLIPSLVSIMRGLDSESNRGRRLGLGDGSRGALPLPLYVTAAADSMLELLKSTKVAPYLLGDVMATAWARRRRVIAARVSTLVAKR